MAHDGELDRLKAAQDLTFQRQQDAFQAMQAAGIRRTSAREALNQAHEAKQSAYAQQDSAWQHYMSIRRANGPEIDSLNSLQEAAYQNMRQAFAEASAAHERRDGAAARSYADKGHAYKVESRGYVARRRRLVEEIRTAREQLDAAKPAFQQAKAGFGAAKQVFDAAKEEHERTQEAFRRAKAEHDAATAAFRSRLEYVKAEGRRRNEERQALARQAGVPTQYIDKVWVSRKPDGVVNLYFGGEGAPNGPGHGHYVLDPSGKVTYKRDPYEAHGTHNFTDTQDDYYQRISEEAASGEFAFRCRFRGFEAYVESNTNKANRNKIDIYYGPNGPFGPGHHHAVAYRESPFDFVSDELR